ncbi:hypothetical protein [Sphingomonas azotifigens]|uniref:hypothetical protein n=1 Tax=Sphingomonas azotifigens TaxID=330920 RepID=UPI000A072839|nr:hypothetical protein [Sphingomonas azotifigens]
MRDHFPKAMLVVAALLVASMLIRCVDAAYQPHSPEVASAHPFVVASSAQARILAPAAEAGRSSSFQGDVR